MFNKKHLMLIVFLLSAIFLIFLLFLLKPNTTSKTILQKNEAAFTGQINPMLFYDKDLFINGIKQVENHPKSFPYHVYGGITPHHTLPSYILADFYQRLSSQHPKTIILIGPNHYERGNFKALVSMNGWDTAFGTIAPDLTKIKALTDASVVSIDDMTVYSDHAVASSIPYIKYFIPDAKIIPILLSSSMSLEDCKTLASTLNKIMDQDTVFVTPVDFSHYLTTAQASKKDIETQKVLISFDYNRLFSMNNDYLDSPPSIATLLITMQDIDKTNLEILDHNNSGLINKNEYTSTTSYFEVAIY